MAQNLLTGTGVHGGLAGHGQPSAISIPVLELKSKECVGGCCYSRLPSVPVEISGWGNVCGECQSSVTSPGGFTTIVVIVSVKPNFSRLCVE
jgi:hypothetical protein